MNEAVSLRRHPVAWLLAIGWLAIALLCLAPRAQAQQPLGDPPGRAARLADAHGQVWLYSSGDSNEWTAVGRNQPLTSGDRLAVDDRADAEISLGTTTLRLGAGSELEIARLDDARFVVRLLGGSVGVRLRSGQGAAEFELDTDEGRFTTQAAGRYRFDRFDGASDATVFAGRATFENRSSALPIAAGQHAQFWLDGSGIAQFSMMPPARDEFAAWNDERDRSEDRAVAPRFVSAEMTGAGELDRYGQWEQSPEDGALWIPAQVGPDWAPYRVGRWAWVRPWGWTWVDDAPWGFAPFHYGRWVRYRERWAWAPGRYVARPVYAPALVAWFGGGRGSVAVSVGGPPVGWVPLAPREVYVPSYRASPGYVRNVNVTHVNNVGEINRFIGDRNGEHERRDFRNRDVPGAVTFVPSGAFAGRQPIAPAAARFRSDPQARQLFAEGRPTAVLAPPVAAPPVAPRAPDGRPPRPPFEGRAPGNFAGRPGGPSFDAGSGRGGAPAATPNAAPTALTGPGRRPSVPLQATSPLAPTGPAGARPAPAPQPTDVAAPTPQAGGRPAPSPSPGNVGAPTQPTQPGRGAAALPTPSVNANAPTPAPNVQPGLREPFVGRPGRERINGSEGEPQRSRARPDASVTAPAAAPPTPAPVANPLERTRERGQPRSNDSARPAEAPAAATVPGERMRERGQPRAADAGRPAEPPRQAEAPRPAAPAETRVPRQNSAPAPAPVAPAAEARPPRPEAGRAEAPRVREERREEKREPNDRVR